MLEVDVGSGEVVQVEMASVTNYSLAARRAWQVMPKRAGRPRLDASVRKQLVSMRLEVDVWRRLGQAAELGLVSSREQAVNDWIEEKLAALPLPAAASQDEPHPACSRASSAQTTAPLHDDANRTTPENGDDR